MRRGPALALLLALAFAAAPVAAARAQDAAVRELGPLQLSGRVMVILDSSGSMWGHARDEAAGERKYQSARRAFAALLDRLAGGAVDVDLGLMTYGHRQRGACEDIQLLVPPGSSRSAAHREELRQAAERVRPLGMTPLTESVRRAAEALRHTEERAIVVLISDGIESCEGDPCELATELEATGIDFTAHVVGFDLTQEELAALQCVARNTGGQMLAARDAATLGATLEELAERIAREEWLRQRAIVTFGVRMVGGEGPFVPPGFLEPLVRVEREGGGIEPLGLSFVEATAQASLPAGRYRATLDLGGYRKTLPFEVGSLEAAEVVFELAPSRVVVRAVEPGTAAPTPPRGIVWRVFGDDGAGPPVAAARDVNPLALDLPPGGYRVVAALAGVEAADGFVVPPERPVERTLTLAQPRHGFTLTSEVVRPELFQKLPAPPVEIALFRDEGGRDVPVAEGRDRLVAELPAGVYRVRATFAGLVRTQEFTLTPERPEPAGLHFSFGPGKLEGRAVNERGAPIGDDALAWTIAPRDPRVPVDPAELHGARIAATLPPGAYHVAVRYGSEMASGDYEVAGEAVTEIELVVFEPR